MNTFSIIIPVKMGGLVVAGQHLKTVMPHNCRYEVIIAEGSAPSRQRNRAAFESSGDILYFLDDDSLLGAENVPLCSEAMMNPEVAVVGGPSLTPQNDSWLQHLFGYALASPFGAGAVCNRYRQIGQTRITSDKELILCNMAVRRSVFVEQKGFNESLYPNEENEFLERIASSGLLSVHIPNMAIYRSQRRSLGAFIRQMFNYGRGRAQQTLITGSWTITSFIPLLFVVYVAITLAGMKFVLLRVPLMLYLCLSAVSSLIVLLRTKNIISMLLPALFSLMHAVNGCGLLWGLLNGKPVASDATPIRITKIKCLDE